MAAIRGCSGTGAAKLSEQCFVALAEATRATSVDCAPLTADSDLATIGKACKALGRALGALDMDPAAQKQRTQLQDKLAYPGAQLNIAFKAHLRDQEAGGELEDEVRKSELAELEARRELVVGLLIQPAAAPAHVKMKDLFRQIRNDYPDAWKASCGAKLEKANAALEETEAGKRREIPKAVVDKWQAALLAAHREGCKFKDRTVIKPPIKGNHLYKFELAGTAASSLDLGPLVAQQ